MQSLSEFVKKILGYSEEELLSVDMPNKVFDGKFLKPVNPSKYILFKDIFIGNTDFSDGVYFKPYFKKTKEKFALLCEKGGFLKELFKEYDGLIMPVGSGPAPLLDGIKDKSVSKETILLDEHLLIANFGGFPSITIPNGFISNLPVGINITGNVYEDEKVLSIAYELESIMNYKGMISEVKNEI